MKILILSDYPSEYTGGAQIIARLFADSLRDRDIDILQVNRTSATKLNSLPQKLFTHSNFLRELRGIVNPIALFKLQLRIRRFKPEVIWIHNVNNYWSWSSLLISKLNAKTILTCHELSAISNLKMKKNHFDSNLRLDYTKLNMSKVTILLLRIKHLYLRILFKQVFAIAIGEICRDVLVANNFRITARIPNRVQVCAHDDIQLREPNSVLFAGRLIEKGLKETAIGVAKADMRLFLIGPAELYNEALQYCPTEKVEYLGNKSHQELLKLLHNFEIVSVCSQSFDNYPTIGLEALVHGCKVVTSELTGLSRLLTKHGIDATVQIGEIPDFRQIQTLPNEKFQNDKLMGEITDPSITVESYLDLIY